MQNDTCLSEGMGERVSKWYLLKEKVVVKKPPEWKFMDGILRNAKFKGS